VSEWTKKRIENWIWIAGQNATKRFAMELITALSELACLMDANADLERKLKEAQK
jgi:hypothetical protein